MSKPPGTDRGPHQAPDQSRRAVSIHDVAREAGVSISAVSRALNKPGRLNIRTEEHIQAVATRLGYHPNPVAQALGLRRTATLALLLSDVTNPFFFGVIRGAERQAAAAGFTMILSDAQEDPDRELRNIRRLSGAVDGFILASTRLPRSQLVTVASRHRIVLVNRQLPGLASVVVDNDQGARHAIDHLASLGHTAVTYVAGPKTSWSDTRRWRAIQLRAFECGIAAERVGPFAPSLDSGPAAADAAIARGTSAILAFNDLIAIGVLDRLAERGVRVPEDVSVVGFDDIFGSSFCRPALTTLAAPTEEVGRAATQLLIDAPAADSERRPRAVVLGTRLIVRRSTGPAPDRARLVRNGRRRAQAE